MFLQATLAVGVGSLAYLRHVGQALNPKALLELAGKSGDASIAAKTAGVSFAILGVNLLEWSIYGNSGNGPVARSVDFFLTLVGQESRRKIVVDDFINEYNRLHKAEDATERNSAYSKLVNHYYELATLFYEVGWCPSFHFAYRMQGENFVESIRRHEYYLSTWLGLSKNAKVTLNDYQVKRANHLNKVQGLSNTCRSIQADFMQLTSKFKQNEFDGVYAIEATCHAPQREGVYGEIFKVLKPGGVFACYEWCLTDNYNSANSDHKRYKKQIEEGDGLPDMCHTSAVNKALETVGFEIIHHRDMALDKCQNSVWYITMTSSWNPFTQRFQFNPLGMFLTKWGLKLCEFLYLVPSGTSKVQCMLQQAALGLAGGGKTGVFTPMYLVVARKPKK